MTELTIRDIVLLKPFYDFSNEKSIYRTGEHVFDNYKGRYDKMIDRGILICVSCYIHITDNTLKQLQAILDDVPVQTPDYEVPRSLEAIENDVLNTYLSDKLKEQKALIITRCNDILREVSDD